ncbi:threonine--tRNA ligase [Candidatus Daviesbacteria bacterium RIFCSPHIGHO2_01_FULL_44_29]|uniref:Threonine--tRNA ligase n=1 Tax=Candidatus Daviesbacteria bacterium RIFCSPHIGHO2_02_FULL_43_12 TaxID=1797776 RepID=A0A1F5KFP0_9BACT|nr:MAG: threonine--tRNA ligase [Candidatus Daviesbacteria bacterium RIFCSPHIGHO2_01_FULL_44_29]OGE38865.1 MAG: threonine--tRNA ligase [Candidatus Daviesbacteria bacterium RIFCSPHIGHO2_12_FULL_47_45]OGE39763.1 MAG: threonine--tRNA ligase [Candidatus Daviesbacteria bacterium RIFCSPHIGHO2_02_FULL_43_12]OGE69946.1 MAG: threonine--tRNA ligase [Candidatus Daviesbacteria bacterium RIFCSPLOWO2_01_FULL_43_15]
MNSKKLEPMRHSCEHILTMVMIKLFPGLLAAMGPATEEGFYFDFDFSGKISEEDFPKIEQEMQRIIELDLPILHSTMSVDEVKKAFAHNSYKLEWAQEADKRGEQVSIYTIQGKDASESFVDICKGPHVESTGKVGPFKLLSLAGAYWHGDEKNKMLTRIYGTAFPTQEELDKYLWQLEQAKKRDHRKLGKELDLFVFSDLVGKGLPLFTPKGTVLREALNNFSQELRIDKGFQKVWIPHITNKKLYETSGHWAKFGKELFLVTSQETTEQLVVKPMNCPHHQQIFASQTRSYKDLPIKYLETTTIYRDEKAGELLGLSRVRSVTQDDSHIFCTPEQIEAIYTELIEIVKEFYGTLGMTYKARLSFRDPAQTEKYLGDVKLWDKAQDILLKIANEHQLDYYVAEGEAAFYGPKIDFMVMDAIGREWQLATPQLDFVQPQRFKLKYIDVEGKEQTPVMIHFALMGSIERFLSVYIEHTAGNFPVWLSPVQVKIIPITDRHIEYAQKVLEQLKNANIRVEIDSRGEKMQAKIREAQMHKIPYMLIIGDREQEANAIAVRTRDGEDRGATPVADFIKQISEQTEQRL